MDYGVLCMEYRYIIYGMNTAGTLKSTQTHTDATVLPSSFSMDTVPYRTGTV